MNKVSIPLRSDFNNDLCSDKGKVKLVSIPLRSDFNLWAFSSTD